MTTLPHEGLLAVVETTRSGGHVRVHTKEVTPVKLVTTLFVTSGSPDVPVTVAVFVMVAPGGAVTFTTTVIVIIPPALSGPSEQEITPDSPTGGVLQLPVLVRETKVAPEEIISVKVTPLTAEPLSLEIVNM